MSAYRQTRTLDTGLAPLDDLLDSSALVRFDDGDVLIRQGDLRRMCLLPHRRQRRGLRREPIRARAAGDDRGAAVDRRAWRIGAIPADGDDRGDRPGRGAAAGTGPNLVEIGTGAPDFLLSVISQLRPPARRHEPGAWSVRQCTLGAGKTGVRPAHPRRTGASAPQIVTFAATFKRFAEQIVGRTPPERRTGQRGPDPAQLPATAGDLEGCIGSTRPARRYATSPRCGRRFLPTSSCSDKDRVAIAVGDAPRGRSGKPVHGRDDDDAAQRRDGGRERRGDSRPAPMPACVATTTPNMFATLFYAVLNLSSGELEYGNCGHSAPTCCTAAPSRP